MIRRRRFNNASGCPEDDPFISASLNELLVPAMLPDAAPIVARHHLLLVLNDFRGDVGMMDV